MLKSELAKAKEEIERLTVERQLHLRLMGILPSKSATTGIQVLPRALGRPWLPRLPARCRIDQVDINDEMMTVRGWACCPFFNSRTTTVFLILKKGGERYMIVPVKECREDLTARGVKPLPWPLSLVKPRRLEWAGFYFSVSLASLPKGELSLACFIEQNGWSAAGGLGSVSIP